MYYTHWLAFSSSLGTGGKRAYTTALILSFLRGTASGSLQHAGAGDTAVNGAGRFPNGCHLMTLLIWAAVDAGSCEEQEEIPPIEWEDLPVPQFDKTEDRLTKGRMIVTLLNFRNKRKRISHMNACFLYKCHY